MSTSLPERVRRHRAGLRAAGLRPVQIWVPDARREGFAEECRRQSRLLRDHITAYGSDSRISGMMLWILRDFAVPPTFAGGSVRREFPNIRLVRGINQKGLYNYRGHAKPSMPLVARLYGRMPTYPNP